jgi:hypothetical protein
MAGNELEVRQLRKPDKHCSRDRRDEAGIGELDLYGPDPHGR